MRGKSLIKDVSVNELLALREQGLTNAEIAKKMDVHYTSVHRLIGPQPDGLRKKPERKVKPMPPVCYSPIPEMPHKSFAQRLDESYGKYCKDHNFTNSLETAEKFTMLKGDIPQEIVVENVEENSNVRIPADEKPCTLADLAREAHERKMAEMNAVGTEERTHIPELIAVFGAEAVAAWLKVSLYDMGIPDRRPMSRQKMLETLKNMNAGGASV